MKLKTGDRAPSFRLPSTAGRDVALEDLRGSKVVLYFYPKDNTPGCTREACDFRDNLARIKRAGAEVFGVSRDSLSSHERFSDKLELPFELLSDSDNRVASSYGAYGEKSMYGRKVMGTIRSTFLIDENGRVQQAWSPVKVDGHVDRVLAALTGQGDALPGKVAEKGSVKKRKKAVSKKEHPKKGGKTVIPKKVSRKKK